MKKQIRNLAILVALAAGVSACSKPEEILTGMREGIRSPGYDLTNQSAVASAAERAAAEAAPFENRSVPVSLGPVRNVASWPSRGANPQHLLPNAALSGQPQVIWAAKAGAGNDRKYRITAEPVSDGQRIFTMDSHAQVVATSTGGATLWTASLDAPGERGGSASGGGLALGDGKLFATTTQGQLVALDPATGAIAWRQQLPASVQGAPTVSAGKVFVTTGAGQAYAIRTDNGRIDWNMAGVPSYSGVSGVAAPAVSGNTVYFPVASGSIVGADIGSGELKFVARVLGDRPGAAHAVLTDIPAEPVVTGGVIYAANAAGRAVALSAADGTVIWSAVEGAQGPMAVAGGAVFFVNDQGKLVRLSARDGAKVWEVEMPHYVRYDKPRKLKTIFPGYGPVMAGGRLWIASGDGVLRGYNPADGALLAQVQLPAGAASRPILVGGALYVMTEKGQLVALR